LLGFEPILRAVCCGVLGCVSVGWFGGFSHWFWLCFRSLFRLISFYYEIGKLPDLLKWHSYSEMPGTDKPKWVALLEPEYPRDTTIFDKNFIDKLLVYVSEFEKTDKYSEYDSIRNRISAKMLVEIHLNNGTFSDYLLLNIHGEVHFKNKIIEPDLSFLSLLKKAVPDFDCPWNMY
jgi:hypothetical protein